jgi:DNA-directed RNA polymerase specialized sigma24 family protein
MAPMVVIPENYDALPQAQRKRIIPICIRAFDEQGRQIASDWFSRGVAPIRKQLVGMAYHALGDPWCASELAETTVHRLWARHGDSVGRYPARRVLKKAVWIAEELKSGDWRKMKYPNLYLALDSLDEKIRDQALADPLENGERLEEQIMLDSIEDRLQREGRTDLRTVYQLLRRGYSWQEIADRMEVANREIVKRRFYRWIKRAAIA